MNDSMKPLKSLDFKRMIIVLVLVALFGVSLFIIFRDTSKLSYETEKQQIQGGTMSYLQALCDKDYSTCDSYIASDGFRITGFDRTSQAITNPISSKVYYQYLDYAVDSIQSVKILSITENVDTGYTEYEIEVSYIPYKKISELDVNSDKLVALMDKFSNEEITDEEFSIEIQDYYFELFKTCFSLSSEEYVTSKVLMLSEKEDENGAVYVYNTKTFIEGLISDEMKNNLEVYQSNIKAKVDTVLRQY